MREGKSAQGGGRFPQLERKPHSRRTVQEEAGTVGMDWLWGAQSTRRGVCALLQPWGLRHITGQGGAWVGSA